MTVTITVIDFEVGIFSVRGTLDYCGAKTIMPDKYRAESRKPHRHSSTRKRRETELHPPHRMNHHIPAGWRQSEGCHVRNPCLGKIPTSLYLLLPYSIDPSYFDGYPQLNFVDQPPKVLNTVTRETGRRLLEELCSNEEIPNPPARFWEAMDRQSAEHI